MKIIRTGHHINEAVSQMLKQGNPHWELVTPKQIAENPEPCIGYGILRGCAEAFKACEAANVEWWQIDRPYWDRNRFLRFSYRGTQAAFIPGMSDSRKVEQGWPEAKPYQRAQDGYHLLLPPTTAVAEFFGIHGWVESVEKTLMGGIHSVKIRTKNGGEPDSIETDLAGAWAVTGFNSSLMVEAELNGVPAWGASQSMIGSWRDNADYLPEDRDALFNCMAHFQFDHEEISSGKAWEHLGRIREDYDLQSLYRLGC